MTYRRPPSPIDAALQRAIALKAPLDERLGLIKEAMQRDRPAYAAETESLIARLQAARAGSSAPAPGQVLPPFLLPDAAGGLVGLADLLTDGPVVIALHRGHWCHYCRMSAIALGEVHARVTEAGGRIVAIAPDRRRYSALMCEEAGEGVTVLTDIDNAYATSLDLVVWIGDELRALLQKAGFDLSAYHDNANWMLPVPATFIVNSDGTIAARYVDPDYRHRMDIDDLVSALKQAH